MTDLETLREEYAYYLAASGLGAAAFRDRARAVAGVAHPTAGEWVRAAARVARACEDAEARADGYACALEARWAAYAREEARLRAGLAA